MSKMTRTLPAQVLTRMNNSRRLAVQGRELHVIPMKDLNSLTGLITSRAAREQKLAELEAIAAFGNLTADGRELLARLRRNDTIADAVSRLADIAPDVDGNARRGQYLHYMHGSLDCPGWGRHYARGTYVDRRATGASRQNVLSTPVLCLVYTQTTLGLHSLRGALTAYTLLGRPRAYLLPTN